MEAAIFALDIMAMIMLLWGIVRVDRSGDAARLGWFSYREGAPGKDGK